MTGMGGALLDVRNLTTRIRTPQGSVSVVREVSITLHPGEIYALVGESGSGKSMTVQSVVRMVPRRLLDGHFGKVVFEGTDLLRLSEKQMRTIRGGGIAMVFQSAMTVLDPCYLVGTQLTEVLKKYGLRGEEAQQRIHTLLTQVGISDPEAVCRAYPHQLSGGLRQRVVIAMALAGNPRLLIADEPTSALDPTVQLQVLDLFQEINRRLGTAILLITHDFGVVARVARRVGVMYKGEIVEEGDVAEVIHRPRHPYTRALLGSVPDLSWVFRGEPRPAAGETRRPARSESSSMTGCPYLSACPESGWRCKRMSPPMIEVSANHHVKCWKRREEA
ncbi:dipeptide ABC transporter (ATP-binding subunit) [Kyrpidia spormannii]|uniref:Dipeptide ABC transporter (ATP-binding subunit) n=1 Tax=Kyrpidia spormannii TaxID=2055160 RepID=A0ACA8ZF19_9BACL|nr:dipeptide ABC transporter (ATP-binding subunit) [Kyrpidia spormannii]